MTTAMLVLAVPLVAVVAVAVTLTVTDDPGASAFGPSTGRPPITIKNFAFHSDHVTVKVGTPFMVINADDTTHTITSDQASAFNTGDLAGGKTTSITVRSPGTYAYHCDIHNYMTGVITATG